MDGYPAPTNWTDWDYFYNDTDPEATEEVGLRRDLVLAAICLDALIFLLGLPGNAAVIWIAGLRMRRKPNAMWFLNLAAADLLCCLSLPFLVAQLALELRWPFGWLLCKVLPAATIFAMFASVFVLTGISVDRCLMTLYPLWAHNRRTADQVGLACGLAWALALLMSLPSSLYREIFTLQGTDYCTNVYPGEGARTERVVQVTRFLFGFLLPFLVIGACNGLIALRVRGSRFSRPGRVHRLLLLVLLGFFVCWLPYHVVGLLLVSGAGQDTGWKWGLLAADPLITCLAYLNSCLNPFLYAFMGRGFKQQVRLSLRRIFEHAFEEEEEEASGLPGKPTVKTIELTA
ncbi:C3a anaphylatoxin chemotactic receptor-like [Cetorhinus maximus]